MGIWDCICAAVLPQAIRWCKVTCRRKREQGLRPLGLLLVVDILLLVNQLTCIETRPVKERGARQYADGKGGFGLHLDCSCILSAPIPLLQAGRQTLLKHLVGKIFPKPFSMERCFAATFVLFKYAIVIVSLDEWRRNFYTGGPTWRQPSRGISHQWEAFWTNETHCDHFPITFHIRNKDSVTSVTEIVDIMYCRQMPRNWTIWRMQSCAKTCTCRTWKLETGRNGRASA